MYGKDSKNTLVNSALLGSAVGLSLFGLYKCAPKIWSSNSPINSRQFSESNVSQFSQSQSLSQQFVRINRLSFNKNDDCLTQTPDNFYTVFTGENKDNELDFATRSIINTRKTIPFASNRLDDFYAEMAHIKEIPPKKKWDSDSALERFESKVSRLLSGEHMNFFKEYNVTKIAEMDDKTITQLLDAGEKYHGVCVDMARLSTYHINHDEKSDYVACKTSFSDNKDIFPENTLGGSYNPKKLTVSNNHSFVIAFKKDNVPANKKITWADAVQHDAVIVDPWFKMAFKASDPNALKYIYYSLKAVYSLEGGTQNHNIENLYADLKELDEKHDSDIPLSEVLEMDLNSNELSNALKLRSDASLSSATAAFR